MNTRHTKAIIRLQKENENLKSINADLLEVAKRVITEWNADWDMPQELIQMAKKAISKVEGKVETRNDFDPNEGREC